MLDSVSAPGMGLRAALVVAGASLARHQLAVCQAMGSEHVVCLCRKPDEDVLAVQRAAEATGMRFSAITSARQLLTTITANDDLLVLDDGFLADQEAVFDQLKAHHCVMVQPADAGSTAGFERLDADRAFAGAMRIPGRLVAELGDLPADYDTVSALTRIALQAGIPRRDLPASLVGNGRWNLCRNEADAHQVERLWLERLHGEGKGKSPGKALAGLIARRIGPALLNGGGSGRLVPAFALILFALGLTASRFAHPALALSMVLAGWLVVRIVAVLQGMSQRMLGGQPRLFGRPGIADALADLALMAVMAGNAPDDLSLFEAAYVPAVLIGIMRSGSNAGHVIWHGWLEDRFVLIGLLIASAAAGWLREAGMVLALALLVSGIVNSHRHKPG